MGFAFTIVSAREIWQAILYSLPLIFIAFYLGNKLHNKVPNERFANLVYFTHLDKGLAG